MATTFSHSAALPATTPISQLSQLIPANIRRLLDKFQSEQWTMPECWRNRSGEDYRAGMRCHALATSWRLKRRIAQRLGIDMSQVNSDLIVRHATEDELAVYLECLTWTKSLFLRRIENQSRTHELRVPLF